MFDFSDAVSTGAIPGSATVAPATSQSFSISNLGTTNITTIKLIGLANYLSWIASVKMWFKGQGQTDHLTTKAESVPETNRARWEQVDA